jgi:hypothetical protein
MEPVRDLVAAAAHERQLVELLRHDPEQVARRMGLGPESLAALRSADRFFETEKPILDAPAAKAAVEPRARVLATVLETPPAPTPLTVSSDTGTLLSGPWTGAYTLTSSATATVTATPSPTAPAPSPSPVAPSPGPQGPRPPTPAPAPAAPMPGIPVPGGPGPGIAVPAVPVPGVPVPAVPVTLPPCAHRCGACRTAAVAAIVAEVAVTAQTAMVALTALAGGGRPPQAHSHATPHGRTDP